MSEFLLKAVPALVIFALAAVLFDLNFPVLACLLVIFGWEWIQSFN